MSFPAPLPLPCPSPRWGARNSTCASTRSSLHTPPSECTSTGGCGEGGGVAARDSGDPVSTFWHLSLVIPLFPFARSGFARFTNTRYSTKKEDITNTFMHLTNVAIQKHAPGFDSSKGMKWSVG